MRFTGISRQTSMDVTDEKVTIKSRSSVNILLFFTLSCLLIFPASTYQNIPALAYILALVLFAAIAGTYSKKIIIDAQKRVLLVSHRILGVNFEKQFSQPEIQGIDIKKSTTGLKSGVGGMIEVGSVVVHFSTQKPIKIDSTSDFDYLNDVMAAISGHLNPTRQ